MTITDQQLMELITAAHTLSITCVDVADVQAGDIIKHLDRICRVNRVETQDINGEEWVAFDLTSATFNGPVQSTKLICPVHRGRKSDALAYSPAAISERLGK